MYSSPLLSNQCQVQGVYQSIWLNNNVRAEKCLLAMSYCINNYVWASRNALYASIRRVGGELEFKRSSQKAVHLFEVLLHTDIDSVI